MAYVGEPKGISAHFKGVNRVIFLKDKLHNGKTQRCGAARVIREAEQLIEQLDAGTTT